MAAETKPKRGRPRKPGSTPRKAATYHLYTEQKDGSLKPVGTFEGRKADEAVSAFLEAGGEANGQPFVIVPDRNLSRVTVAVETTTKVKLSAA